MQPTDLVNIEALRVRFWARVAQNTIDQCWLWLGPLDKDGYGLVPVKKSGCPCGTTTRASRLAHLFAFGYVPDDKMVCHDCDNPPCCNPFHFFLGTALDNAADRNAKGRTAHGPGAGMGAVPLERRCIGERCSRGKLTADQAREVRRLRAEEGLTYTRLGQMFGISYVAARLIVVGKNWKYLQ